MSHFLVGFVAARILQGSAAALMAPVGRIVLLESTEKRNLVSVMTISTVPMLVAPTVGPALGGFITTYWSGHPIVLINVPVGIAGMLLALRNIPAVPLVGDIRPFDSGIFLFVGSSTLLFYGLQRLGDDYPHCLGAAVLIAVGAAMAIAAVRHARLAAHPIVSLAPLKIPSFYCRHSGRNLGATSPTRPTLFAALDVSARARDGRPESGHLAVKSQRRGFAIEDHHHPNTTTLPI